MQDAKRLRVRAEMCLQIAELMSDGQVVAELRTKAADHLVRAVELETTNPPPSKRDP
jgi:hypothetical protein